MSAILGRSVRRYTEDLCSKTQLPEASKPKMHSLLSKLPFLRSRQSLPPAVPTDEVIPTHLFDDTKTMRSAVMPWMFRFDDVLDPDKLNISLSYLFQMEGWRKFGGRFRLRVSKCSLCLESWASSGLRSLLELIRRIVGWEVGDSYSMPLLRRTTFFILYQGTLRHALKGSS